MFHRCLALIAIGLLYSAPGTAQETPARGRTISPFNGRDFTGWDGDPRFWTVEDGMITARTTRENPTQGNTFLIWRGGTVRDFELSVKFRIVGGNSGIQYRSKDLGNWMVGGYQADFEAGDRFTGIVYEERGRGILGNVGEKATVGPDGKPRKAGTVGDAKELLASVRKEQWNEYVVTAVGNHLVHAINGRVTAEVMDEDPARRAAEGILALQLHAGPPMLVQFKDIRLTVLNEPRPR